MTEDKMSWAWGRWNWGHWPDVLPSWAAGPWTRLGTPGPAVETESVLYSLESHMPASIFTSQCFYQVSRLLLMSTRFGGE